MMFSPRVAPVVFGLGLLEAIPAGTIESNADPSDRNRDGISGRANYMEDLVSGELRAIGRFGWKANTPNLVQQAAGAYNGDMGITSTLVSRRILRRVPRGMRGTPHRGIRFHRGRGRVLHPVARCSRPVVISMSPPSSWVRRCSGGSAAPAATFPP